MPAHLELRHDLRDVVVGVAETASRASFYREVFHTCQGRALGGPMSRGMLSLVIDPERSDEYDALHAEPWPELIEALADSGFRNYTGFRRGPHVLYYGEYYPDMRAVFGRMAGHEVDARWGEALRGVITTIRDQDGWLITADESFHLRIDLTPTG
jgi:L-rhamnose mutarotase